MSRVNASKTIAILIVLTFLSITLAGSAAPVETMHEARTTAAPSPSYFGPPVMVNDNTSGDQEAPIVVAVTMNELFAVWEDPRSSAAWKAIYSSRSSDNGTTWTTNKRVDDPIFNSSTPTNPAVAVTRIGTILITWQDDRRNSLDYDIFFAKSYDYGDTFTKNVKVDDSKNSPTSVQERPSIAVTFAGIIYIAWTDDRTLPLSPPRVRGAYSTDMGVTFSPSKEIVSTGTSGQNGVNLVVSGNRIYAAFIDNATGINHPYVCSSSDGGKTFTTPTRLDDTGSPGKGQNEVSIAPMPNGGIVATWTDYRNGDKDIYASIVQADCKLTTPNIRVDNDSAYINNWQEGGNVATDQLGNVYAAWQDDRPTGSPSMRFAILKAGMNKFAASVVVAKPGLTDYQMRASIVVRDPGRVSVAWQEETDTSTSDVYVSSAYFPNLYGIALVGGWNFVSLFVANSAYKASTLGLKDGDTVARWNSSRGVFDRQYIVNTTTPKPALDFAITQSTGYWIWAKAPETISLNGTVPTSKQSRTIAGPAGGGYWATVGFVAFSSTRRASDIPVMYTGGATAVVSYNPTTGKYSTYVVGLPSTDFKVVPGQAYWLWCVSSGVLSYYP